MTTSAQRAYWRHAAKQRRARYGKKYRVEWIARCPDCGGSGRGSYIWGTLVRVEHGHRKDGTVVECYPGRVA